MGLVKRNKGNKYPRDPLVGTSMWRCLGLVQERGSREIMGSQKMVMVLELVGRKKIRAHRRAPTQPRELDTGRNTESPRTLPGCLGQMVQCWVWDVTSKDDAEGQHFCPGNRGTTGLKAGPKNGEGWRLFRKGMRVLLLP